MFVMKRNINNIVVILVGIIFLCWYLPVAYNNVFACDDYWFGANVRNHGFWGNQLFYYINWEGSYTHTFSASLPHVFHFSRIPFLCNIISLVLLYTSLFFFLKTYTNISSKKGLAYSLYFMSFLYLCTKGDSEIRFWICANLTYVSEMSFLLTFFALYHNIDKNSYSRWCLLIFCIFAIGGSKLTFILYAIAGIVIHDILFERRISKNIVYVYLLLSVFVMLNVAAPGNLIRLKEETMPKDIDNQMNIWDSSFYRILEMKSYFINTLFLLPIAGQWSNIYSFKKRRVLIAILLFLLTFILDGIIMFVCFHDSGPLRVYFVAEVLTSIMVLFILNHYYTNVLSKYKYSEPLSIMFAVWVSISNIFLILHVPNSIEYSKQARERDKEVSSYASNDTIKISPLPDSYLLLSYFANDEIWLKNIYLPYFDKKCKVVILDSSK